MTILSILLLYLCFRLKQFVCDFLLQTDWMALNKGKPGREGYMALATHAGIHGVGTALVMLVFAPGLWWLGLLDIVIHGAIDRFKGKVTFQHGWTPNDRWFWWSFGLDQEAHNLTHFAYILVVLAAAGGVTL